MTTPHAPGHPEVIGVLDPGWAKSCQSPQQQLIAGRGRFAAGGEDPFELARYLSSGNDTGASSFSPGTGGGTMVRNAATGEVLARYRAGAPAGEEDMPFLVTPDGHWPAWAKAGGRIVIGCQCGRKPAKPPARMSTMHVSHQAHRRTLGLRPVEYAWPDESYGVDGALSTGPLVRVRGHAWKDGGWVRGTE